MQFQNESNYIIGDFEFISNRNLLSKNGVERTLEPMQSKILLFFIKNKGKVVSRDLLEKEIWEGRVASEQSVNNKIADLRKTFGDDYRSPKYFKTHKKSGYELIADCHQLGWKIEDVVTPFKINKKLWSFILLASIIFTFIPVYLATKATNISPDNAIKFTLVPVTSDKGQEWGPSLSSDREYLAYAHKGINNNWQIRVKNLETDEVIRITDGLNPALSPTWSQNDDYLYFVSYINKQCVIMEGAQVLTSPLIKVLTTCGDIRSMSPLSVGPENEWLYFSNLKNSSTFVITRINLLNGMQEDMTAPPISGSGDYTSTLSHDGESLTFLRAVNQIQTELMLLNVETRELKSLRKFNHKVFKLAWSINNQEILYLDKNNDLSSLNVVTKNNKVIASFQNKILYPYHNKYGDMFLVDGDFYTSDIFSINLNEEPIKETEVISSSFLDYAPALGNTKQQMAYTSNKTGISQIWLERDNKHKKLTIYKDLGFIIDKHISPDDSAILFLRDSRPYILDIDTLSISNPLLDFEQTASPIWMCGGKDVLISAKQNGSWNLYQIDLDTLKVNKKLPHVTSIKSDCNNSAYYVMLANKEGIYKLHDDLLSATLQLPEYHSEYSRDWQIYDNKVFILQHGELLAIDLYSHQKEIIKVSINNLKSFRLSNDKIYYSKRFEEKTNIKQMIIE